MKDHVAQNAGIVDDTVELAEMIGGRLDDPARRNGFGDAFKIRYRRAAALLDLLDHLFGRRRVRSRAIGGDAGIVDHDLGAFRGAEQRDLTADAAARAGDDDGFVLE
jgi:hypothetical protein